MKFKVLEKEGFEPDVGILIVAPEPKAPIEGACCCTCKTGGYCT